MSNTVSDNWRRRWMSHSQFLLAVSRYALTAAAMVWIGSYFVRYQTELLSAVTALDMRIVGGAAICVLIGLVPGAFAWQQVLARDLPTLTIPQGVLVYLRSAIGKYTPGGILAFAIQYRLLKSEGAEVVLLLRVFASTAIAACLAAALIAIPAMTILIGLGSHYWTGITILFIVAALLLSCRSKHWPWLSPQTCDRMGFPPPALFAKTIVLMIGAWIVTGSHLAVLGIHTGVESAFFISAYAFSAIAGIVFAVLPGAFGIRDGALLMILILRLDPVDAVMLALLSRTLIMVGDVIGTVISATVLSWGDPTTRIGRRHL